jgi:hypothetical protein
MQGMHLQEPRRPEALRRLAEEAVRLYNRYRGAEARARLERIEGDKLYVRFKGSFCETCGINDWVDDFTYTLEDLGAEAELVAVIEPPGGGDERIGVFRVRRIPSGPRPPQAPLSAGE